MQTEPSPSHESNRVRRRVSTGMRKVITFMAKRVNPRKHAGGPTGANTLLRSPTASASSSRFRQWLPAGLATFMTVLTGLVLLSVLARLPTVFADTKAMSREIEKLAVLIHPNAQSPDEQKANEEALRGILSKEDEAQRSRKKANEELGAAESDEEKLERRQHALLEQQTTIDQSLDESRRDVREILGRDIIVHKGPPTTYDPGEEPRVPWYYPTRRISTEWLTWHGAKDACDKANDVQRATGIDLEEVGRQIAAVRNQIDVFNGKLAAVEAWIVKLDQERNRYTAAPGKLLIDLDNRRKELVSTSFIRTGFWLLDIPTLLSCLATTAVAYSRMFLVSGRFAPRQLVGART